MSFKIISNLSRLSLIRSITVLPSLTRSHQSAVLTKFPTTTGLSFNIGFRNSSTESNESLDPKKFATYEEVKELPNYPQKLLIDVREPKELQETGIIPTAINIPLKQVAEVMSQEYPVDKFKKRFNREKPSLDTDIIIHCKIGVRSQTATDICYQLGYKNVKNYKGSWLEWAEKEGLNKNN